MSETGNKKTSEKKEEFSEENEKRRRRVLVQVDVKTEKERKEWHKFAENNNFSNLSQMIKSICKRYMAGNLVERELYEEHQRTKLERLDDVIRRTREEREGVFVKKTQKPINFAFNSI